MREIKLAINKKIEVVKDKEIYKSVVQDLNDDNFCISIPVNNGIYLSFINGEEVDLFYYIDSLNCYTFKAKVIERVVEGKIHLYRFGKPYDKKKIQRRNFVRVSTVEYIYYKKLKEDKSEKEKWEKAVMVDLSGGGLRIKLNEKPNYGDELLINLLINEEKLEVKSKIVRIDKSEDKQYLCGVNFIDLQERIRDKIIEKVFAIMRKQREAL